MAVQNMIVFSQLLHFYRDHPCLLNSDEVAELKRYESKIVTKRRQVWGINWLRFKVFHQEFAQKKSLFGVDIERVDRHAIHLIVKEKKSAQVVGYYRLIISENSEDFYADRSFKIDNFLKMPGKKMELSRACVSKKHRNGFVLKLLWQSILKVAADQNVRWVFGIPSVPRASAIKLQSMSEFLHSQHHLCKKLSIPVRPGYAHTFKNREGLDAEDFRIPSLMKFYYKHGAKSVSQPAYDRKFDCLDYFTYIDLTEMSQKQLAKLF